MSREWRRKRGSKLQCKLPQQCSRVVLVTGAIVSSPVNKEEEKEMEEEEGKVEEENKHQEEEDEIRNTMQCHKVVLMGQSNCFFPVSEEVEEEITTTM